ncbi:MarR family winged helix-turn-helix transcriptional regulator [Paracoccus suum]|nr:MarR family transcriptional regulator [Paracoccus suum]
MDHRRKTLFSGELGPLMLLSHVVLGNNLVTDRFTRRQFDLPVQAWSALYAISQFPGIRAKEIAFLFPRPQNTISRALATLEERGLITREASGEDAREKLLFISPEGEATLKPLISASLERQKELFGGLTGEQTRTLMSLLELVVESPGLIDSTAMDGSVFDQADGTEAESQSRWITGGSSSAGAKAE